MTRSLVDSEIARFGAAGARLPDPKHRKMVEALIAAFIAQARAVGGRPDERFIHARITEDLASERVPGECFRVVGRAHTGETLAETRRQASQRRESEDVPVEFVRLSDDGVELKAPPLQRAPARAAKAIEFIDFTGRR